MDGAAGKAGERADAAGLSDEAVPHGAGGNDGDELRRTGGSGNTRAWPEALPFRWLGCQ
jgi:hypothetical protein